MQLRKIENYNKWCLICELQGPAGAPGMPGIPGAKGHRVSIHMYVKHTVMAWTEFSAKIRNTIKCILRNEISNLIDFLMCMILFSDELIECLVTNITDRGQRLFFLNCF
jgi:hypothetical protein